MKILFRFILPILFIISSLACETGQGAQLVLKANNEWIKGRNHSAIEMLKSVLKKYPSGQLAEEALFRLGEIYHFSLNNSIQAISYFQEVMELNKNSPFGSDAQKYIAEIMEFTLKDYDQAIIEYQKLIHMCDEPQKIRTINIELHPYILKNKIMSRLSPSLKFCLQCIQRVLGSRRPNLKY